MDTVVECVHAQTTEEMKLFQSPVDTIHQLSEQLGVQCMLGRNFEKREIRLVLRFLFSDVWDNHQI